MKTLSDIETPALVVDKGVMERNIKRMADKFAKHGVPLRPHVKTTKCASIAKILLNHGAKGVTVACLKEAEHFLEHGIDDLLYAVCLTPNKLPRVKSLMAKGANLSVLMDQTEMAQIAGDFCAQNGITLPIWIEIDCGENRTGLNPDDPRLGQLAKMIHEHANLQLVGVLTHGGHAYGAANIEAIKRVAEEERFAALKAKKTVEETLSVSGLKVSIGSTPTAMHGDSFDGVSEVRAGVYVLGDLFQWQLRSHQQEDIAVSVLAQVMSVEAGKKVITDAGGLALSKDRSTQKSDQDYGYGLVCDQYGKAFDPVVVVNGVHQEHGEIYVNQDQPKLPDAIMKVGALVRVLPNHACMMAAPYDRYYVVDGDDRIVDEWSKTTGW